ncbi:MAG: ribosome small subunit-dependent GTPase A [Betaproteobacteria bacterium]
MASSFLTDFGWRPEQDQAFAPYVTRGCVPARVASESQHLYSLYTEQGEVLARVSGKFRHTARGRQDFPAVGDWVAASLLPGGEAVIHGVLPRHSRFSRKVVGETTEEQVVAANVDTIFLVSALTNEFNPRRLERYLVMAWESGATPVIVLNKTDLCPDVEAKAAELGLLAAGVPVHPVSGATGQGLDALLRYLEVGRTVAFLGSSGVGKSTLINRLCGQKIQATGEVRRSDDRGRHTTTRRELVRLPGGGLVIDTPGMRELQLWTTEEGLDEAFSDVARLAERCRFGDCCHAEEPGCAVRQALEDGSLDPARYESYLKLQKELAYLERRQDQRAQLAEKEKWKRIHLEARRRGHR